MSFNTDRKNENGLVRMTQFFGQATRRIIVAGISGALAFSLAACGSPQTASTGTTTEQTSEAKANGADSATVATDDADKGTSEDGASETEVDIASFSIDASDLFSARDLDASYDETSATKVTLSDSGSKVEGDGASVDGSTVTITAEGTYVLAGSLSDGRVVVDVDDSAKVQLVLDGAQITSSTGTALYVRNADKVFVTLADGSKNALAATGAATEEDDHTLDGALFSSDDLTINGGGELSVSSTSGHGVVGKDEVTLVSGNLKIEAAKSGIQAKDSVAVKDGSYTITAGTDGVHAEHETNGAKGFVYVAGGTFDLEVQKDGIDASNDVLIDGGTFNISAEDDGIHSEYDLTINDGTIRIDKSYESLEGATVTVTGGDIDVAANDDGINATGVPSSTNSDDVPTTNENGSSSDDANGAGAKATGDEQATDGTQAPDGGQTADGGQVPDGGQAPDGGQTPPEMPTDGQMPQDGQMPDERQMRDGGERPEGMPTPPDGQMPEGMQAPDGQMPTDGQMPEGGQMPGGGRRGGRMSGFGEGNADGATNMRMGGGGDFENDPTASVTISGGKLVITSGGDSIDSNGSLTISGGETYVNGPTSDGDGALDYTGEATVTGGTIIALGSSGMAQGFGSDSTQGSMLLSAEGSEGDLVELKDASGKVLASYTALKNYSCVVISAPGIVQGGTYTLTYGSNSKEVTLDALTFSDVTGGMMGGGMRGGMMGRNDQASQTDANVTTA
jgi:hypothetical protein